MATGTINNSFANSNNVQLRSLQGGSETRATNLGQVVSSAFKNTSLAGLAGPQMGDVAAVLVLLIRGETVQAEASTPSEQENNPTTVDSKPHSSAPSGAQRNDSAIANSTQTAAASQVDANVATSRKTSDWTVLPAGVAELPESKRALYHHFEGPSCLRNATWHASTHIEGTMPAGFDKVYIEGMKGERLQARVENGRFYIEPGELFGGDRPRSPLAARTGSTRLGGWSDSAYLLSFESSDSDTVLAARFQDRRAAQGHGLPERSGGPVKDFMQIGAQFKACSKADLAGWNDHDNWNRI